jgi:hypothetical protein
MSGWNSLDSVGSFHTLLQVTGLMVAVIVIAAGMTAYHFWNRWPDLVAVADRARRQYLPRSKADTAATVHNTLIEVAILGTALLLALGYAAFAYGQRKTELVAINHAADVAQVRTETETLRRTLAERDARASNTLALRQSIREAEVRHLAETAALRREIEQIQARRASAQPDRETEARLTAEIETLRRTGDQTAQRHAAEIAELQGRVRQAESRRAASVESLRWEVKQAETRAAGEIARLERELAGAERKLATLTTHRRLSIEEKYAMIDALRPFAGQKISIAAIDGDEDGKVYAKDFIEVFEAAGWEHPDIAYRRWDRDPVGVEITLNEADGRAGRVNVAVGALINVVRKLSLTDGNTIYMNGEVPAGQVQIKIGKKLLR